MEPTAGKIFGLIGGAVRIATQAAMIPSLAGIPTWRPSGRPCSVGDERVRTGK